MGGRGRTDEYDLGVGEGRERGRGRRAHLWAAAKGGEGGDGGGGGEEADGVGVAGEELVRGALALGIRVQAAEGTGGHGRQLADVLCQAMTVSCAGTGARGAS